MIQKSWLKLLLIIGLWVFSSTCFALNGDESKPIQIDVEPGTATFVNQSEKVTTLDGNITITQGSMIVHAKHAIATQDSDGYRVLDLTGNPVTFSQKAEDGQMIEGQGNHFVYNTKTNLAVLSGRSRVKKGNNSISGDVITYNIKTQVYSVTSGRANGINKKTQGKITIILEQDQNGKAIK